MMRASMCMYVICTQLTVSSWVVYICEKLQDPDAASLDLSLVLTDAA